MATCPGLGHSIENGIVSYSGSPTDQGDFIYYAEGTTITVLCDEGYRGGGNIICQNDGNWSSSSLPNCTSEPLIAVQTNATYWYMYAYNQSNFTACTM